MRTIVKCRACKAEVPVMTNTRPVNAVRRCPACSSDMYPIQDSGEQTKSRWHPVPAYRGAKGYEGQPHIINQDGELVAVFENFTGPDGAVRAAEDHNDGGSVFFDLTKMEGIGDHEGKEQKEN